MYCCDENMGGDCAQTDLRIIRMVLGDFRGWTHRGLSNGRYYPFNWQALREVE